MKKFQIKESVDLTQIGAYPQSIKTNHLVDESSHLHINNFYLSKIEMPIAIPEPILQGKAKLTDMVSCVYLGYRLVISHKLKSILEKHNSSDIQYLPVALYYKKEKLDYWLVNPYLFQMENIHFKLSEIWKEGMGNKKINTIIVASYEEFKIIKDKTVLPERISIEKPVLLENTSQDLFILDYVKSGIGYYVSEMVKNEMEEAGCTGIRFEEINTSNT